MDLFWKSLKLLQKELIESNTSHKITNNNDFNISVIEKIEEIISTYVENLTRFQKSSLSYNNRNLWSNVSFSENVGGLQIRPSSSKTNLSFESISQVKKLSLTLKLLSHIHYLLQTDSYCTKRELFYLDPKLFESQGAVDEITENIACMLSTPRWTLHIVATSKGVVAGNLRYKDGYNENYVDCETFLQGMSISCHVEGITDINSKARFILIIEKDAAFQKLLDEEILRKFYPCIIITGKGYPDVNTRQMVNLLWDTLHIPILALVDSDPHGIEIMSVYRFGSRSMSHDSPNLATSAICWLGILPSDITRLHVPKEHLIPFTQKDKSKAQDLLNRPYIQSQELIKSEIEQLKQMDLKAEIECLNSISSNFLTEVYLQNKISNRSWI